MGHCRSQIKNVNLHTFGVNIFETRTRTRTRIRTRTSSIDPGGLRDLAKETTTMILSQKKMSSIKNEYQ